MKKNTMMMLVLVALATDISVNAENASVPARKVTETVVTMLSTDELAFAAKLSDSNRKSFNDKLSVEQRKAIMIAVKNGANADEAVQNMLAAKEMKDVPAVVNAEKSNAENRDTATK
jgi:hypothetical protein